MSINATETEKQTETVVEWTIGDHAMVVGPRYHDGDVASIRIGKRDVELVVDVVGGGQTCFRFRGAEFGSVGLISHAIISDVFAFPIHKSDDPDRALSEAIHILNGGTTPLGDIVTESRFMLNHHEDLMVFFTCSYGGPFSVLCHQMVVTRRGY